MRREVRNRLSNHIRGRNHFFTSKIAEKSMYQSLILYYKKYFQKKNVVFKKHNERVLTISLFLLTTSSFLYKKEEEGKCTFHWRNYLHTFSKSEIIDFLYCATLYLLEYDNLGQEDAESIRRSLPDSSPSFTEAYSYLIVRKIAKKRELRVIGLSIEKYINLIPLALRLSEIIREEISNDYSKVFDLVELSDEWKEKMTEIFGFKSEYIAFLYFVNLRVRKKKCLKNYFIKLFCWITFIFTRK